MIQLLLITLSLSQLNATTLIQHRHAVNQFNALKPQIDIKKIKKRVVRKSQLRGGLGNSIFSMSANFRPLNPADIDAALQFSPKLKTAHPILQKIMACVHRYQSIRVFTGHRSCQEQNKQVNLGQSHLKCGKSKHNVRPSLAVDAVPYSGRGKIDWSDYHQMFDMVGWVYACQGQLSQGHRCIRYKDQCYIVESGITWRSPVDPYHFQLRPV